MIIPFFDPVTSTVTYLLYVSGEKECVVIDPVLDYDPKAGSISTTQIERVIQYINENHLNLELVLETHAHADHLSAAYYLKKKLGARIGIGASIVQVQDAFKPLFNFGEDFIADGAQFDYLYADNESFKIGSMEFAALHVPGHTPADMAYQLGQVIFVGDTLLMPDVGTARCDFPGGSADLLYDSIQRILNFPDHVRLYMCHDYPPNGRSPLWETSVGQQHDMNIHIKRGVSKQQFATMRQARDRTLSMPTLIWPSLQINIRAGEVPQAENNGKSYLKIPLSIPQ